MDEAMRLDRGAVRRAFERAAASYDSAAVLQREVAGRMLERLDYVRLAPGRVLDAGAGTGHGSRALLARYPAASLVGLDIAHGMLRIARGPTWKARLPLLGNPRAGWVCGDLQRLPLAAASVDLAWSNLALQWCDELPAALAEFHRVLAPGGLLSFSTFGPDTLRELREAFAAADDYIHVSRFADMHDIGDMLVRAGFGDPVVDMEYFTMTYADALGLMRDLKALGAHNATLGRRRGLTGKAAWRAAMARYEALRRDGVLPATFEVVYGHAWRPEGGPRRLADGRQAVRFHRRPDSA